MFLAVSEEDGLSGDTVSAIVMGVKYFVGNTQETRGRAQDVS